jgi:hypothetical protein
MFANLVRAEPIISVIPKNGTGHHKFNLSEIYSSDALDDIKRKIQKELIKQKAEYENNIKNEEAAKIAAEAKKAAAAEKARQKKIKDTEELLVKLKNQDAVGDADVPGPVVEVPIVKAPIVKAPMPVVKAQSDDEDDEDEDEEIIDGDEIEFDKPKPTPVEKPGPFWKMITSDEKSRIFWNMIAQIQWANKSDMVVNLTTIKNSLEFEENLGVFKEIFAENMQLIIASIEEKFIAQGIVEEKTQRAIASHFIALGRDWFDQACSGSVLIDFIISAEEYQDFASIIDLL